jgi:hypothetical protein
MAGNVWCSRKWYYELPFQYAAYQVKQSDGTDPTSSEFGQCCYGLYQNNKALAYANTASSCPAIAGSPSPASAAAYWCSDTNLKSVELAIATCRQQKQICGDALVGETLQPYQAITVGVKNDEADGVGNYSMVSKYPGLSSKCGGTSNTIIGSE